MALTDSIQTTIKMRQMNVALSEIFHRTLQGKFKYILYNNRGYEPLYRINRFNNGTSELLPEIITANTVPKFNTAKLSQWR